MFLLTLPYNMYSFYVRARTTCLTHNQEYRRWWNHRGFSCTHGYFKDLLKWLQFYTWWFQRSPQATKNFTSYFTVHTLLKIGNEASEQMPNMRADSNYQQCWRAAATTWNITSGISSSATTRTETPTEQPSTHPHHISTSKPDNHTSSSNSLNHLIIVHAYHFSEARQPHVMKHLTNIRLTQQHTRFNNTKQYVEEVSLII